MTERISRKQGSSMLFRFFRATAVGAIAVGAYVLLQPRVAIPAHLAGHKVLNIPNLISEEAGNRLNELMREMKTFDSNINADLKSGFSGAREDIGEGQPVNPDGSCSHQYLIPNVNKTLCALPQRIDVGRHFMLSGGPDGVREPYEMLIDRLSSFGKYMTDLSKLPVVEELFASDGFQDAAKQICPADKQYLDPFQFNFIIQVPGQTVALHIDAPYFWGANRRDIPQWLLAAMVYSGLFKERFIDQVQVVGYLHKWHPSEKKNAGGDFIYYRGGDTHSETLAPVPLAGNSVDGSKTVHAALVYRPDVKAPHIDKSSDATLEYTGNEKWNLMVNGKVQEVYDSDDLRVSIVYRARCFKDEAEKNYYHNYPPEKKLTVDDVLETMKDDLAARNVISRERSNLLSTLKLALYIMDTYITYPMPAMDKAWIPYNYCALPKLFPVTKPVMSLFCK